jgi:3-oxoacyl-[acyl-carrier-protein] synthase II
MKTDRRVVVTGMGMVTPLGIGINDNWQALCQGQSGIGPVTRFDTGDCRTKIAGEVRDFEPTNYMDRKTARRATRFIQYASASSRMALEDAGLNITPENSDLIGVSIATALGGVESFEKSHKLVLEGNRDKVSPFFIPSYICNLAPGEIAIQFGAKGPLMCSVTACAAGTHSIGEAFRSIQYGEAEVMIAGGTEGNISPVLFAGLDALHVLSARNEAP